MNGTLRSANTVLNKVVSVKLCAAIGAQRKANTGMKLLSCLEFFPWDGAWQSCWMQIFHGLGRRWLTVGININIFSVCPDFRGHVICEWNCWSLANVGFFFSPRQAILIKASGSVRNFWVFVSVSPPCPCLFLAKSSQNYEISGEKTEVLGSDIHSSVVRDKKLSLYLIINAIGS